MGETGNKKTTLQWHMWQERESDAGGDILERVVRRVNYQLKGVRGKGQP